MKRLRALLVWLSAAAVFAAVAWEARRLGRGLGNPLVPTGWALASTLALLAAFNARKRLSMLPLGTAAAWLRLHVAGGVLALGLFWLHAGSAWPKGLYEQALAALFYIVTLNGVAGYVLQKLYPVRLTATGVEVIFERIPEEIARLREQAEAVVLACTAETGSDVLARHYVENYDWFFRRPRFLLNHALGLTRGRQWVRLQGHTVQRYLGHEERAYLDKLRRLAFHKNDVDFHYAAQGIMKGWLLIHIPLAAALMVLAAWHILLVHVYAPMKEPGRYDALRQGYERPNFGLRCGREALWQKPCHQGPNADGTCGGVSECRPFRKGDRWECRRPAAAGGPCSAGPRPDGACSTRRAPCAPRATLRVVRGRLAWLAAGAVAALIAVLFASGCGRPPSPVDPGPLSAKHANFIRDAATGRLACERCHQAHELGAAAWVAAAFRPGDASARCSDCHRFEGLDKKAHNTVFAGRPDLQDTHCTSCHTEHKGVDFAIAAIPDSKCQSCHAKTFESFSSGHPDFPPGFPYGDRASLRFDHVRHLTEYFKDSQRAALAPKSCSDCHDVRTAARKVKPMGFEKTCAQCHGQQMQDPLTFFRLTTDASGVKAEPTPFETFLLGDKAKAVYREMSKKGTKPLVELLKPHVGDADARRLFGGANEELVKGGLSAWEKGQSYELSGEEPPMGGWYWSGDLMVEAMELKYKPSAHADPVVRAWLDLGLEGARSAKDAGSRRAAAALRDKLLHAKEGAGRCMKCHVLSSASAGLSAGEAWRFSGSESHPFLKFSHKAHLRLAELQDCRQCHALSDGASRGATGAKLAFRPIRKETCLRCHGEGGVRQDCRLCHFYHKSSGEDVLFVKTRLRKRR